MEILEMASFKSGEKLTPQKQEKLDSLIASIESELTLYRQKLTDGTYEMDSAQHTPEQKQHQKKIEKMVTNAQALKNSEKIKEGEYTFERYCAELHPFMLETYKRWSYNEEQLKK